MKQIEDINSFADPQKEGLDSDTNDNFVPKGHSRYRLNCRSGSSGGSVGIIENVKGTVLCSYTFEEDREYTEIGSCDDAVNSHIYYFVAGGDEHYILRYSVELNSITLILRHALLNFSASNRIHNPAFIDGVLLWTDGNNPPRSLIVQNAINYTNGVAGGLTSYAAITEQVLDAIIYPPGFPPTIEYGDDLTKDVNNLRGGMWQFAYQYVYVDNAKSCWSPYSKVGKPVFDENVDGRFFEDQQKNNYIKVTLNTGTNEVKRINLATRENNIAEWTLIEGIDKYDEAGTNIIAHNINYEYDFYNDFRGEPLDQVDFVRPFDYVPLKTKAQEVSDDERLIYGNNQEGYDNVELDTEIELLDTYADAGIGPIEQLLVTHDVPAPPHYNYGDFSNYQVRCTFTTPVINTNVIYTIYIWVSDSLATDGQYGAGDAFYQPTGTLPSYKLYKQTWQGIITSPTTLDDILDYLSTAGGVVADMIIKSGNTLRFNIKGKNYLMGTPVLAFTYPLLRVTVSKQVIPSGFLKRTIFKQGAYHQFGIVYYDKSNRSGYTNVGTTQLGVYDPQKIYMPTVREIWGGWSNDNYPFKYPRYIIRHRPPAWATHYQIVHSGNQSINKFFTIAIPQGIMIVPPNPITGWRYVADDDTIRIDINSLIIEQKGRVTNLNYGTYGFVPGDRVRFLYVKAGKTNTQMVFLPNNVDVEILGYDDTTQEIMLPNFGLSKIDMGSVVVMEVYTPSKNKDEKIVFKEIGLCYEIGNPGQANAYHKGNNQDQDAADPTGTPAIVSLIDSGDTYLIGRIMIYATSSGYTPNTLIGKSVYICESDSYSDYYPSNDYDFGRPNMINKDAAQRWYKNHYRHGGRKYPMTNLNYLFKFDYDDFGSVNIDHGEITGLRQIGFTLKIIQQKKITSQYIGRTELLDNRGQSSLQKSDTVFGSKKPSEEDYGCYDPGSILANDRYLYFLDVSNGCVVRDAANGMVPISKYFLDNYWKEQCRLMSKEKGKYNVHTVFHRKYGELYMTIVPIGMWIEPMDSFTIHFHEESNRWKSFWSFLPEGYGITNNTMVSFVNGQLHVHEANSLYNNFYGTQYEMILDLYSNEYPKNVKAYQSLAVHANRSFYCPNTGDILILPTENYPNGMISRLTENNFQPMEGVWFSSLLNDMSDPRFSSQLEALFHGRDLRGRAIKIKLTSDGHLETKLDFVTINSVISES